MTENQWDGNYTPPPATEQLADTQVPPPPPHNSGMPTTETIKDEAGNVAEQAGDSAKNVVETAKSEVANVAAEAKSSARDLLDQARLDLTDQAGRQQQKVAAGLRSISEELQSMATASEQPGVATDLVRQAAERSSSVATWLEDRDPGSLLHEVKTFARKRPGTFLLLAAGAGVLAGRLSRGLSAGTDGSSRGTATGTAPVQPARDQAQPFVPGPGRTVPPPAVELPGPTTTTAGYSNPGALSGDGHVAAAGAPGTPQSAPVTEPEADPWPDGGAAEDPFTRDRSHRLGSPAPMTGNEAADAGRGLDGDPTSGESR
ncbi:hypothetical protein [Arthrobacter bambusae]|uniref:hypothetical protein n=1 Tax=Arthrobacter bambusae TaxID=1338426 RepID=UPI002787F251|nr:hypothetical protein [Arthrobacter bambusae]MDQ0031712.1 hypothetical protein [Arthrobacter bambusae]MDQ0098747.1 hypothetical protein [Arthrobacter bambusae]